MSYEVRSTEDIEYVRDGDRALCLDLHQPDADGEFPCVVYFHGGGWMRGDRKTAFEERLRPVVQHGLAIASVSYRLTDTATHPAQLDDGRAAVRWLRSNAIRYGLRGDRIGAWGASAGGWIALMLAMTTDGRGAEIDRVCAWFPVTDLTNVDSERIAADLPLPAFLNGFEFPSPSMEARLLGVASVTEAPEVAWGASPIANAAEASGPVLLIHGDVDGLVNVSQSLRLHRALVDAGRESELLLVAGANHEGAAFQTPSVLGAVAGFLQAAI